MKQNPTWCMPNRIMFSISCLRSLTFCKSVCTWFMFDLKNVVYIIDDENWLDLVGLVLFASRPFSQLFGTTVLPNSSGCFFCRPSLLRPPDKLSIWPPCRSEWRSFWTKEGFAMAWTFVQFRQTLFAWISFWFVCFVFHVCLLKCIYCKVKSKS